MLWCCLANLGRLPPFNSHTHTGWKPIALTQLASEISAHLTATLAFHAVPPKTTPCLAFRPSGTQVQTQRNPTSKKAEPNQTIGPSKPALILTWRCPVGLLSRIVNAYWAAIWKCMPLVVRDGPTRKALFLAPPWPTTLFLPFISSLPGIANSSNLKSAEPNGQRADPSPPHLAPPVSPGAS